MVLQSSKLSNRFKKKEIKEVKRTAKFSFTQKNVSAEISPLNEDKEENTLVMKDEKFSEEAIKQELIEKINSIPIWHEYTTEKQKELIKNFVESKCTTERYDISNEKVQDFIKSLYSFIIGFGPLEYLIAQKNVSAIFVNGENSVYIEIGGRILNTEITLSKQQLQLILNSIAAKTNIDNSKSIWNIKYNNLSVSIINQTTSISNLSIVIRKNEHIDLKSYIDEGFVSKDVLDFIINAISSKKNIVISGDINSGKTLFLETLINSIVIGKRSVLLQKNSLIETKINSLTKLNADNKSTDFDDIVETVLKMEPEYIFTDFNLPVIEFSERNGYVTTLRANSTDIAISKLIKNFITKEALPEKLAKNSVLTNFDFIIQVNKLEDGQRCITSIVELVPARTTALSIRTISKYQNGEYINEFPQPLISIRAESLIAQQGSMTSRFSQK